MIKSVKNEGSRVHQLCGDRGIAKEIKQKKIKTDNTMFFAEALPEAFLSSSQSNFSVNNCRDSSKFRKVSV